MKYWKCLECKKKGESEDSIIIKICYACQKEMEIEPYIFKGEVEVIE